jgi:CHASE1-domain containing sensor protein
MLVSVKNMWGVYYLEPFEGNEAAFGYTISSQVDRLQAIERAFSTGKSFATSRITLVQETGYQFGILILLPIYQHGVALNTVEDRYTYRKGFVTEVLRVGDVVESALKSLPDAGIDMCLYDVSSGEEESFLYFRPSKNGEMSVRPLEKTRSRQGQIGA